MVVGDVIFALGVAFVLTVLLSAGYRTAGAWLGVFAFFAIVFLGSWAGGIWITPVGPTTWGMYWIPFLITGLFLALALAAVAPSRPRTSREAQRQAEIEASAPLVLGVLFWFLLLGLSAAIFFRYVLT